MQNPGSNISAPGFSRVSEQFSPQMPAAPLLQEAKQKKKRNKKSP
jgi:hypothetical protein